MSTDIKKIRRRSTPKLDMKTLKNQEVEKNKGTCAPDQGSGATLGVLEYSYKTQCIQI